VYEHSFPRRQTVEQFLKSAGRRFVLGQKDKKLVHDFLLGYLQDDQTQMGKTLFIFFSDLEAYLRATHAEAIGRILNVPLKDAYRQINVSKDITSQFLPLGDLLKVISLVAAKITPQLNGTREWDDLAALRNKVAHGALDYTAEWSHILETLLSILPTLRQTLAIIATKLGKEYVGTY